MYRARVQAVSGGKVYADGKWLTCIGNKNFRAGEMVWTDGRCAYGHFQESQQPLIIPAPTDEEGIPVLMYQNTDLNNYEPFLYTFSKNKLKLIKLPETFPPNNKYNIYKFFYLTNNKKGSIYIENHEFVIAENIDNKGNFFRIVAYEVDGNEVFDILKTDNKGQVKKIKTFDLDYFRNKTYTEAPYPAEYYDVKYYTHSNGPSFVEWGFIENEDNWAFVITTQVGETVVYNGYYLTLPHIESDTAPVLNSFDTTANFLRVYYITKDDIYIIDEQLSVGLPRLNDVSGKVLRDYVIYDEREFPDLEKIKWPLQENFYYKFSIINKESMPLNILNFTVYSPEQKEIFSAKTSYSARLAIKKVKSSYLFGVFSFMYGGEENLKNGLYVYKNGKLEILTEGYFANQIFCPLKKSRGWQNRIKEISTEQIGLEISKAEN